MMTSKEYNLMLEKISEIAKQEAVFKLKQLELSEFLGEIIDRHRNYDDFNETPDFFNCQIVREAGRSSANITESFARLIAEELKVYIASVRQPLEVVKND